MGTARGHRDARRWKIPLGGISGGRDLAFHFHFRFLHFFLIGDFHWNCHFDLTFTPAETGLVIAKAAFGFGAVSCLDLRGVGSGGSMRYLDALGFLGCISFVLVVSFVSYAVMISKALCIIKGSVRDLDTGYLRDLHEDRT